MWRSANRDVFCGIIRHSMFISYIVSYSPICEECLSQWAHLSQQAWADGGKKDQFMSAIYPV